MSASNDTSLAQNNNFALAIQGYDNLVFNCTSVVLPGLTLGETTQSVANVDITRPTSKITYDPFICRILIDEDFDSYFKLAEWMLNISIAGSPDNFLKDFSVIITNNHGSQSLTFDYKNGYPRSLDTTELESAVDKPSPILLGLNMSYDSFEITRT